MRTFPFHSLTIALTLSLGLWGCAALPPVMDRTATVQRGIASLTLVPHLVEERSTQTSVPVYSFASITRLEVVPYIETSPGSYRALSRVTGQPTDDQDADILKISQTSPIRLQRPVQLTGLSPSKRYQVFARAYDAQGALISVDASSSVVVDVTTDATTKIPVRLADKYFAASTQVTLSNGSRPAFDTVETSLWRVQGASKILMDGTTQVLTKAQIPAKLRLAGLKANTTYHLSASMRKSGAEVATNSTPISVYSDDAVSNTALSLNVPPSPVFTLAGVSYSPGYMDGQGADGDNLARLSSPGGIVYDGNNNLYVADTDNHAIRRFTLSNNSISASSALSTIAGNGQPGFVDDGFSGLNARFRNPGGIAFDPYNSNYLYVADTGNHVIRMLTKSGSDWTVSTIAGSGFADWLEGTGTFAAFSSPKGITVDNSGNLYVADAGNHAIRKLTKSGSNWIVSTVAGNSAPGFTDASGTSARLNNPSGVVFYSGNLYVADTNNHAIRRISASNGAVTTLAGVASGVSFPAAQEFIDGVGNNARFNSPSGIAQDGNGNLFVTDSGNHAIRKVQISSLNVSTFTGGVIQQGSGFQDGSLVQAKFNNPIGISNYYGMKLYVTDTNNHAIRMISP